MALLIIMMENYKTIATMKKMFRNLMLVAVAAMAFVACQNDTDGVNVTPEQDTITMTFVADAPESRTSVAIDGDVATYSWSSDDKIGFYYVDTDATGKKKKNSKTISIDGRTATFTAEFEALEGATNYNIGAFYPGNSWDKHSDTEAFNNVRVKIAAAQSLTENTFDPKADLMMSKPFMNVALENDSVKSLEFTRIAAIGKMNLKLDGMVANEVIKKVKFSLAEDAQFNGVVILDLENSTYTLSEEGTKNYVELTGELAADTDRTAIFFTCFPGEYVGAYTIEVETDKASYSKEGTLNNALTFTAGNVLNFDATVGNRYVEKTENIDILTNATTGVSGTTYKDWTAILGSGITYIGQSAGKNNTIQLRSDKSNSGIVMTTSNNKITKIVVDWHADTTNGRTLNIYGKNSAYSAVTDLYSDTNSGTLIGTIINGKSTELVIDGDYTHIGMRSAGGAMYLNEIKIYYEPGGDNSGDEDDDNTGDDTGDDNTDNVLLVEEFDNSTTADSSSEIGVSKFPNFSGATSKAYTSKYGGIKLGSSKAVGYITSKALDLSSEFTVKIDACKYSSDSGNIEITVGSQTKTIKNSDLGADGTFNTYTLTFDAATSSSSIKIATSSKRAYIDNVIVTKN